MEKNDELLTLEETSKYLKVAVVTLRCWLREGKIKGHKMGRGWRFFKSDLVAFVKENGEKK